MCRVRTQVTAGGAILGKVALDGIGKQADSSQWNSTPPWPLLRILPPGSCSAFLLWGTAIKCDLRVTRWSKPFLPSWHVSQQYKPNYDRYLPKTFLSLAWKCSETQGCDPVSSSFPQAATNGSHCPPTQQSQQVCPAAGPVPVWPRPSFY